VLVVGCSHPGIETIVAEAAKINPHIHFIAGGFHSRRFNNGARYDTQLRAIGVRIFTL
jgi:metal-dependent hydrolase (beta-lactamase superfamily II)